MRSPERRHLSLRLSDWVLIGITLLLALGLSYLSWQIPGLVSLERLAFDLRAGFTAPSGPNDRIVLVVFDEQAVAASRRRAPLDRFMLAAALRRLDGMGAKAIGIDILFDQRSEAEEDRALIATLAQMRTPVRIAYAVASKPDLPLNDGDPPLAPWQEEELRRFAASIDSRNVRFASIELFPDADGVVRRTEPSGHRTMAESLSTLVGSPSSARNMPIEFRTDKDVGTEIVTPAFARLPIVHIADGSINPTITPFVRGRVVLVGAELRPEDRHRTSLSARTGEDMSGLEIHAQILANLIDYPHSKGTASVVKWPWILVPPLLAFLIGWVQLRPAARVLLGVCLVAALVAAAFVVEVPNGVQTYGVPLAGSMAGFLLVALGTGAVRRSVTLEQRRIAREILDRYLPRDVAREIERQPELLNIHGRRTELAILFTDLADFTQLSERLTPEQLSSTLNGYLAGMTEVIHRHGGTLDKFIGDAVVAFWGAPLPDLEAAERALQAAAGIERFSQAYARELAERGIPLGRTRIGVHFGEATVGNFGSPARVQYTAMGDAMNLAARLESANKQLKTSILASSDVVSRAPGMQARDMGFIAVKGREAPCWVFTLGGMDEPLTAAAHNELIGRLRRGDPGAEAQMAQQFAASQDEALAFLARRAEAVGWNGVYALESK